MKPPPPEVPYPGLRPFNVEDAAIFFGREPDVNGMLTALETHRFLAVVGSSGSGKSSLVRAGLLPVIGQGFLLGHTDWMTPTFRPGDHPFEALAKSLRKEARRRAADSEREGGSSEGPRSPGGGTGEAAALREAIESGLLVSALKRGTRGLERALNQMGVPPEVRVLVVVDQFEEIFAFRRRGSETRAVGRDEAAAFVSLLLEAGRDESDRLRVVLTMRSDFIGDCEAFLGLPEVVSRSQFLVPRLDRIQMERAIRSPGALGGRGVGYAPFTFEEGLVNRICNDAGDQPDQLPLMQHALMRTWQHARERLERAATGKPDRPLELKQDDYLAVGGIAHALSQDADHAWRELGPAAREAKPGTRPPDAASSSVHAIGRPETPEEKTARHLFLLLCDASPDGQLTRRRTTVEEVTKVAGVPESVVESVVGVFRHSGRNFVVKSPQEGFGAHTRLDISHEALLRQWNRLSGSGGWLDKERAAASELRRLVDGARLREQGKGSRLGMLELERVREWQTVHAPSASWARRYEVSDEDWARVSGFIESSRTYRRRLRTSIGAATASVILLLLTLTGWSLRSAGEAQEAQRRAETSERLAKSKADVARKALALAEFNQRTAQTNALAAQRALTTYFRRTIGTDEDERVSPHERESLWELARLEADNFVVRSNFLRAICGEVAEMQRVVRYGRQGFKAAVGLDPSLRPVLAELASRLVDNLDSKRLGTSGPTEFSDEPGEAEVAFSMGWVAPFLPEDERAPLVRESERLLSWMSSEVPSLTRSNQPTGYLPGWQAAPEALVVLSRYLPAREADRLTLTIKLLFEKLRRLPESPQRLWLMSDLAMVLARLKPSAANASGEDSLGSISDSMVEALGSLETMSPDAYLPYFPREGRDDTRPIDPRTTNEVALAEVQARFRQYAASALMELEAVRAVENRTNLSRAGAILLTSAVDPASGALIIGNAGTLARLNALLPSRMALDLTPVAEAVSNAMQLDSSDASFRGFELAWFARVMADLGASTTPGMLECIRRVRDRIIAVIITMETIDAGLSELADALADLGARLPPTERETLKPALDHLEDLVLRSISAAPAFSPDKATQVPPRRNALALGDAESPSPKESRPVQERRPDYAAEEANPMLQADELAFLSSAFARLTLLVPGADGSDRPYAETLVRLGLEVLAAIEREQDSFALATLGAAFSEVVRAGGVPAEEVRRARLLAASLVLLEPIAGTNPEEEGRSGLSRLLAELERDDLVEILKYPVCIDGAEELVLATLEAKTSLEFGGLLENFIVTARSGRMGPIDLASIPERPNPAEMRRLVEQHHPELSDTLRRDRPRVPPAYYQNRL